MAHPEYLRAKARQLRLDRQMTLDEIAARLALPRTTLYYWIADIPIPRRPREPPPQRLGSEAMQRKYRLLREAAYAEGRREFATLAVDPTFRDFVCLYIAEGFKRSRNRASLGNSDPAVLRLANHWIRRLAGNRVWYALQYHADQDPEALRLFWAAELSAPLASISLQRKSNSNGLRGRQWRSRYGVTDGRNQRHTAACAPGSMD